MRLRVAILGVLCALTAGLVGSAGSHAQPEATAKVRNGCTAGPLSVSRPGDTVSLTKGECYKNGRSILTIVHYSYAQSDDDGAVCGSVTGKTGRSFTPRISGTYAVRATFTVAPKYKSSGVKPRSTTATLQLGHTLLKCGQLDPDNPPGYSDMCDYQFHDPSYPADNCGSVIVDNAGYSGPFAMWDSKPRVTGTLVRMPGFVTPWAPCKEVDREKPASGRTFMNLPVYSVYYVCKGGWVMAPSVSLFYYPKGSSAPACAFNRSNLVLGGQYSRFSLPADSADWGNGELDIVYKLVMASPNGATAAHVFADKAIQLGGTVSPCAALSQHSAG